MGNGRQEMVDGKWEMGNGRGKWERETVEGEGRRRWEKVTGKEGKKLGALPLVPSLDSIHPSPASHSYFHLLIPASPYDFFSSPLIFSHPLFYSFSSLFPPITVSPRLPSLLQPINSLFSLRRLTPCFPHPFPSQFQLLPFSFTSPPPTSLPIPFFSISATLSRLPSLDSQPQRLTRNLVSLLGPF